MQKLEEECMKDEQTEFRPSAELETLKATQKQFAKMKRFQEAQRAKIAVEEMVFIYFFYFFFIIYEQIY